MSVHNPIPDVGQLSEANRRSIDGYLRQREVARHRRTQSAFRAGQPESRPALLLAAAGVAAFTNGGRYPSLQRSDNHLRGPAPLDVAVLERCLAEIVRRHEIWRTTFDAKDGQPFQVVHPASDQFPMTSVDLRSSIGV